MTNAIEVFSFEGSKTRWVMVDGEPWFVAKDVAEALGYSEASNPARLFQSVPKEWKGVKRIHTLGGEQDALCLSEQGLYFFLGRSDKPKALPYQKLVAGEIMPSIRKHGAYFTPSKAEELLNDPDLMIELLQKFKTEKEKNAALTAENAALEAQIKKDRSKVLFAESVEASEGCVTVGTLAKLLRKKGVPTGRNRLYAYLRKRGYLIQQKGADWNKPTQASVEQGLFELLEKTINTAGKALSKVTTMVTGKGQVYFVTLLRRGNMQDGMQLELFPVGAA